MEEMKLEEGLCASALVALVCALLLGCLGGCSSATGWRVSFGVAPVSQIRDVASLQGNQEDTRILKRKVAKGDAEEY